MNDYKITRAKFFDSSEHKAMLESTEKLSQDDLKKGNTTWEKRWMLVHLAMYSGLRVAEIAALTVKNVHLDIENPYLFVKSGKGKKDRDVYIDPSLQEHLKEFIDKHNLTDNLFQNAQGKAYTTTTLYLSFREARRAAKLREGLSIHSARHTYATKLLSVTNLRYVQKQLGHSSISMTALYADILPEKNGFLAALILTA